MPGFLGSGRLERHPWPLSPADGVAAQTGKTGEPVMGAERWGKCPLWFLFSPL